MTGELHQLSVQIGALSANVENLTKQVREHREESRDEHIKVHDIVAALSESHRALTIIVKEMKPLTDDYREERAERRGAKRFVYAAYALCGGSVAMIGSKIWERISAWPHP